MLRLCIVDIHWLTEEGSGRKLAEKLMFVSCIDHPASTSFAVALSVDYKFGKISLRLLHISRRPKFSAYHAMDRSLDEIIGERPSDRPVRLLLFFDREALH